MEVIRRIKRGYALGEVKAHCNSSTQPKVPFLRISQHQDTNLKVSAVHQTQHQDTPL